MADEKILRRDFLKGAGTAATLVVAGALSACHPGTRTAPERQSTARSDSTMPAATAANSAAGSEQKSPPQPRRVSISVASFQYSYDAPWGLFDIASAARALSDNGSVVAEARVTSQMPSSGGISGLDVEEVIYRGDGTKEAVATGSIRFDTEGRVIAYHSNSGMTSPIFSKWPISR